MKLVICLLWVDNEIKFSVLSLFSFQLDLSLLCFKHEVEIFEKSYVQNELKQYTWDKNLIRSNHFSASNFSQHDIDI
jgi:hypothetical protein